MVTWDEIQGQLAKMLGSRLFARCARLQRFLQFTVARTLAGDPDCLKEYTLAIEVFDRPQTYDPRLDSVVRVEARRLRRKLQAYYRGDGSRDRVRIDYPKGSYVPVFEPVVLRSEAQNRTGVAVLPFLNMSPDPCLDYYCDGITEELISALSTAEGLNVVARTSVFQFKGVSMDVRELGRRLGVKAVIEGSVRRDRRRLRITVQAVDAETGYHLWSGNFDRTGEDTFRTQEEISGAIAEALLSKLLLTVC